MKLTSETVIFITGGASGLGLSAVQYFHALGCKVAVADINAGAFEDLLKQLKTNILCVKCDVTIEADVQRAVEETVKQFGTIHIALACAGIVETSPTWSPEGLLNTESFRKVINTNLFGYVYVAKYVTPYMVKNKPMGDKHERGVLIFISSITAEEGQAGYLAYSATKGGINGMMMPMARDLGRYGIRAVAIAPGFFLTPLAEKVLTDQ
mmetsp:Transcript_34575/g.33790  ORF Transcript_34575/g.33790 Transcript_34575/m.33790 type:complete len:209 (+) Transcript_34575:1-627(+)